VHASFPDADTFFPEFDLSQWKLKHKQSFEKSDVNEFAFDFCEYEKQEGVQ
ncbi:MAG: dihydrofolate reductase, partial [Bacteroidia bacterium]|nr:dihydrofolate reductase [Bacteroidia bacterium]